MFDILMLTSMFLLMGILLYSVHQLYVQLRVTIKEYKYFKFVKKCNNTTDSLKKFMDIMVKLGLMKQDMADTVYLKRLTDDYSRMADRKPEINTI